MTIDLTIASATPIKTEEMHAMTYSDYLSLSQILSAQHPRSSAHDEMLFIIQHQTSELWLKLALYELQALIPAIQYDNLDLSFKIFSRMGRIFSQLIQAWDILATMTPTEYAAMRPSLGSSSGLQSYQYRQLEFLLGNKNSQILKRHTACSQTHAHLKQALETPSLYDEVIYLLARRGFHINPTRLAQRAITPTQHDDTVEYAWQAIYQAPSQHWDLYQMAEKLIDLEDLFRQWRFRHLTTVSRIIGMKTGTGGTSGVQYLQERLNVVLFPEIWAIRATI